MVWLAFQQKGAGLEEQYNNNATEEHMVYFLQANKFNKTLEQPYLSANCCLTYKGFPKATMVFH